MGCFGHSQEALGQATAEFVADGLESGARVIWIRAHLPPNRVEGLLKHNGVDTVAHLSSGRLQFLSGPDCFLHGGLFDPVTAVRSLQDELARARADGFEALRVVQEMPPHRTHAPGAETLREFESSINQLVDQHPVSVLCIYDRVREARDGREGHLLEALEEHPSLVDGSEIVPNPFFAPSRRAVGWHDADGFERRLRMLEEHRKGRDAQRQHETLVRLLRVVHGAAGDARNRDEVLRVVLAEVCSYCDWPAGHAFIVDPTTHRLEPTMVWYWDPDGAPDYDALLEATRGLTLASGEDLAGRALMTRRTTWTADVASDPTIRRSSVLRSHGLQSSMCVPVRSGGHVRAVLEFFSPVAAEPDEQLVSVLEQLGTGLGEILELKRVESELGLSERRFRALVESAADAIVLSDQDGTIVSWNQAAREMFGYSTAEIVGQPLASLIPERFRKTHLSAFVRDVDDDDSASYTVARRLSLYGLTKEGREFPVELSVASWVTHGRRYFSAILRDVSAGRQAEAELALLGSAVANVRESIVVSTAGGSGLGPTMLYVNPAFTEMTGYTESQVLGRSFGILTGPKTDSAILERLHRHLQRGEPITVELTAYRRDGSEFLMEWHASPIQPESGKVRHFVSVQRDVTDERIAEAALRRADRDPLTGLANRDVLVKRLRRAIERTGDRIDYRYALLFLDLDGFKTVNDSHGHIAGDQILASAARRIERSVRPGDTVARFGGDEFVVLLEYVSDLQDVMTVAERIQAHLSVPFVVQGHELLAPASIGIALSDSGYSEPDDVIRDADEAMYRAKQEGRGRAEVFDAELYEEVLSLFRTQSDLSRSLERGELELYYQPLVALGSERIIGFEALLRWQHPERGLVLPDEFIPVAEDSGLIVPIGRWALREACRAMVEWERTLRPPEPLILSMNLSVKELITPDIAEAIHDVLEETGFEPSRLQLEITESVFIERPEAMRDVLQSLRAMGVQVCIDDFGTGYSSLGYLHRFPIGLLKIDRLFVHDLDQREGEEGEGDGEIIRTILALAQNLGLEVLAEGVETERQAERLKGLECKYAQGFLFSHPVRSDEVALLLGGLPPLPIPPHGSARWN